MGLPGEDSGWWDSGATRPSGRNVRSPGTGSCTTPTGSWNRDSIGAFFETDRLVDSASRQAAAVRPASETPRRLHLAVLDHQDGRLQDDATTVLVEWLPDDVEHTTTGLTAPGTAG